MKKILVFILALVYCGLANAIVVQKVYLRNGSVLEGYIQKQSIDGKITVHSDKAVVLLDNKEVSISGEKAYGIEELDDAWVNWAEKNDAFQTTNGKKTLVLADVIVHGGKSVKKVRVLESGTIFKYLELTANDYVVNWEDVEVVRGEKRSKLALSGVNRVYHLKNGEQFEGQYAAETDSTLSLYMGNGSVRTFKTLDVVKYVFKPVNSVQSLFEQSPLLDVLRLTNNTEIEGIIIEQNYVSNKDSVNYVLIKQMSGAIQSIKLADIKETLKIDNNYYNPQFDIELKQGEVMVNRKSALFTELQEMDNILIFKSLEKKVDINSGDSNQTIISVEYNSEEAENIELFTLVKVSKTEKRKGTIYGFSYKDVVNTPYRSKSIKTSVNKVTKTEYQVTGKGVFALFDVKNKRIIPIVIGK